MPPDEDIFAPAVFTRKRERPAEHGLTQRFFGGMVLMAIDAGCVSDEHFAVDWPLIQCHASLKNFMRIARGR
jgi:hypothetical protein